MHVVEDRQPTVFVPNWFTVDFKTGADLILLPGIPYTYTTSVFTICSFQDENDCFFAWESAREMVWLL